MLRPLPCLTLLLCSAVPAIAAPLGISLAAGSLTRPTHQGIDDVRLGIDTELPWQWRLGAGTLSTRLELGLGHTDTSVGSSSSVTLLPSLHYQFDSSKTGHGWFLEGGVGPAYVSERNWAPYWDLGSHWQFFSRLGGGYAFGAHEVGAYFQHFSNAGLAKPNPGADMVALRYRYAF